MAIDSKLKRMSAVGARRLPWMRRFTPSPESSVDQADRQHVAFSYRGILAGAPLVTTFWPTLFAVLPPNNGHLVMPDQR